MAQEDTRQKFLLLSVFGNSQSGVARSDIRKRLSVLSQLFYNTNRYVNNPEPFGNRLSKESGWDAIERLPNNHWRITETGISDREESFRPFIEAEHISKPF